MHIRMDWRSVRFDWSRVRAFLVTAEEGSLSAAARALGVAQPTLGRQVAALEEELGVALFERAGRGLEPTPAGLDLLDHARAMGEAASRLRLAATGQTEAIEGRVCISASEMYACFLLPRLVARLRRDHPALEIEVVASNALSDLRRHEADIAIRNARPDQPELIARHVRQDHGRFYATPGYLDSIGRPGPEGMGAAGFVGFDTAEVMAGFLRQMGLPVDRRNIAVISGSHMAQWAMVKAGAGIGVAPAWVGDVEPDVEPALPGLPPVPYPVWLVAHRDLARSRRIRLVHDLLAEEIAALPAVGGAA